jgi:hypothetical protein
MADGGEAGAAAPAGSRQGAVAAVSASPATATITQERTASEVTATARGSAARPAGSGPPLAPHKARRRWWKVVIWSVVVVAVLTAAVAGVRIYIQHQWYVGDAGGRVAIYNGIPTKVLAFDLSRVEESTALSSAAAERLAPWRGLHDGITAESLSAARGIVEQIRQDLQGTNRAGG